MIETRAGARAKFSGYLTGSPERGFRLAKYFSRSTFVGVGVIAAVGVWVACAAGGTVEDATGWVLTDTVAVESPEMGAVAVSPGSFGPWQLPRNEKIKMIRMNVIFEYHLTVMVFLLPLSKVRKSV